MKIVLQDLTKTFPGRSKKEPSEVVAVDHFNFEIPDGKLIGLLGPSGCGKSTTLNLLCGLLSPTDGSILFGDEDVTALPPERRGVGMVFQNYALYPHLTVRQNILFPLQNLKGKDKLTKAAMNERTKTAARLVQIEELMERKPSELSGGQQQRVALARTLNQNPKIILADEPVASLDPITAKQVMQDFVRINKEYKISILLNIHHVDLALKYCDRVIGIRAGEIVFDGPASTITQEQIDEVYNGAKAPTMGEGEGELPKAARAEG